MNASTHVCALPGCQNLTEKRPGRPPRRYCCAAHWKAAHSAAAAPPSGISPATPAERGSTPRGSTTAPAPPTTIGSTTPRRPRASQYRRLVPEPKGEHGARRRRLRRLAAMPFVVTAGRGRRVYIGSAVSDRARSAYPPAGGSAGSRAAAPALARLARACLRVPLAGCALLL